MDNVWDDGGLDLGRFEGIYVDRREDDWIELLLKLEVSRKERGN